MKTKSLEIDPQVLGELVAGARLAAQDPVKDTFWDRLAAHFADQRKTVGEAIQPRPARQTPPQR